MRRSIAYFCIIFLFLMNMAGCASASANITPAATIKVGIPGPYTGSAAAQGMNLRYGAEMAIEEINAAGGINGKLIEPVYADTENKAEVAVSAYQKLCSADKVDVIVGEVSSSIALAVMDVLAKYQMPTIFAVPAADSIGEKVAANPEKYGCIFMTDPPSSSIHDGVLSFLKEASASGALPAPDKTAAIIAEDSDYGKSTANAWRNALKADGWNIVVDEVLSSGETDFYAVYAKIAQTRPNILKIEFTSVTSGVAATKQLIETGLNPIVFAGFYMKSAEFASLAGNMAQYHINVLEPVSADFAKRLLTRYSNASASGSTGFAYDSVYIMKEAIQNAGSLDSKALAAALSKTDYNGVSMRTVYDPRTHFAKSGAEYKIYVAGQYVDNVLYRIYPADTAQRTLQLPITRP